MRGFLRGGRGAGGWVVALAASGALVAGLASTPTAGASSAATATVATTASAGAAAGQAARVAAPAFVARPHAPRLPAGERQVCATPSQPGQMACQAVIAAPSAGNVPGVASRVPRGYSPASLQSAYRLSAASARRGRGETVAIVDAYNNPDLARNLASYRRLFHLPACSTNSGCLRIVNQSGRAGPLPRANAGWGLEESLDLDMVSAICPHCRILLVEARSTSTASLGTAEDTAVAKGARFVSNSWSGGEFIGQDAYDHYFNHPGDAIVFASGDYGYGALFPTDTQYVTAVGGTRLTHRRSGGRAWTESVWGHGSTSATSGGTGSGCSTLEAKPSWQLVDDTANRGCLNRTENDVAAVADPSTGVAIYDTYRTGVPAAIFEVGGTSAATPLITAAYALAGPPARGTYPASYLYRHASHFNPVTSGTNGRCESSRQYLCTGKRHYSGPAGLGTPNGIGGFARAGTSPVTLVDPGTQDVGVGTGFKLTIPAVDSDTAAKSLSYAANGLPAGLTISSAARSLDGAISGKLPAAPGNYLVTVTGKDARTGRTGSTRFNLYVISSMTAAPSLVPIASPIVAGNGVTGRGCLAAASPPAAGDNVVMDSCGDGSVSLEWDYFSDAAPGVVGSLTISAGTCLGLDRTGAVLQACNGSASQQWEYLPTGVASSLGSLITLLYNPASHRCLDGRSVTTPGERVKTSPCSVASGATGQDWTFDFGVAILSGRAGQCMSGGVGSAVSAACAPSDQSENWQLLSGAIAGFNGCLAEQGTLDGQFTGYENCGLVLTNANGLWLPGPGGELINANSGRCLDNLGIGRRLTQEDCYGQPGEVWALN